MHATTERWLDRQPTAATLVELQAQLDRYRDGYNTRRHQALDMLTPEQVYAIVLRSVLRHAGPDELRRHWPGTPTGLQLIERLASRPRDN